MRSKDTYLTYSNWVTQSTQNISLIRPFYIFLFGSGGVKENHTVNTYMKDFLYPGALGEQRQDHEKPTVLMHLQAKLPQVSMVQLSFLHWFFITSSGKSKSFHYKEIGAKKRYVLRYKY